MAISVELPKAAAELQEEDDFLAQLYEAQEQDASSSNENPGRKEGYRTRHEKKQEVRDWYRTHHAEVRLKRRQAKEAKKKEDRRALLSQFETSEERTAFVLKQEAEKKAQEEETKLFLEETMKNGKPRICFNCSFADVMDGKELSSLVAQIGHAYSFMKAEKLPFQFNVTSCPPDDPLWERIEKLCMQKFYINYHAQPYWEVYEPHEIVVLSPDAEDELEKVDEDKVYVIGGLVDRRVKLNQTRGQARFQCPDVQIRKLPFKQYMQGSRMSSVLNVDTVVGLLMDMYKENDWQKAFDNRIPQRKRGGEGRKAMRRRQKAERAAAAAAENDGVENELNSADNIIEDAV